MGLIGAQKNQVKENIDVKSPKKSKWYKTWWGIILIILVFPLFLCALLLYLLYKLTLLIWKQKWSVKKRIVVIVAMWGFVASALLWIDRQPPKYIPPTTVKSQEECIGPDGNRISLGTQQCKEFNEAWKKTPQNEASKQYSYEVLDKNENKVVENYKVLIKPGDNGKEIAMEVKKECKKPCNISIFDNKDALLFEKQYDDMMGNLDTLPEELQEWKKKHYIFVADHLVGYVDFESGEYEEYPYKDSFYDELKVK